MAACRGGATPAADAPAPPRPQAVDRLVASTNDVVGQAMAERDATNRDIESLKAMIADFQQQVTQVGRLRGGLGFGG